MTFWDFCAPFYDRAERVNTAYIGMLRLLRDLTPQGANVFEAAAELKRISGGSVFTTVALLKGLRGFFPRPAVGIWRLFGFAPKREFDADGYRAFLCEIGLPPSRFEVVNGNMPMAVAVWRKP
jgi:hypothetical protein